MADKSAIISVQSLEQYKNQVSADGERDHEIKRANANYSAPMPTITMTKSISPLIAHLSF
jgi:hypothetical protein